mgnify:CR=1 FL=1
MDIKCTRNKTFSLLYSKSLEDFEKGGAFLTNQISLKDVAKLINTNSKYLSKIINTYKGKNFANT